MTGLHRILLISGQMSGLCERVRIQGTSATRVSVTWAPEESFEPYASR